MRLPRRSDHLIAAAALLGGLLAVGAQAGQTIDVWLDLDPPATVRQASAPASAARIALVRAQQDGIAARLPALGAVELARVQQVGNAMAVRIDADRIDELKALPGVKRVRPVRTLHPPRPMP
ncbi:MAG: hypothetical protein QM722_13505 [Piscinibacter sp.]